MSKTHITSFKCPPANGGCGNFESWLIALDYSTNRLSIDCLNCGYRFGFFLEQERLTTKYTGPLDRSGPEVHR